MEGSPRKALVSGRYALLSVRAYLPSNSTAEQDYEGGTITISGLDRSGWTLDEYVIPRLASGLIFAEEVPA
jgi:hypothetical protein